MENTFQDQCSSKGWSYHGEDIEYALAEQSPWDAFTDEYSQRLRSYKGQWIPQEL